MNTCKFFNSLSRLGTGGKWQPKSERKPLTPIDLDCPLPIAAQAASTDLPWRGTPKAWTDAPRERWMLQRVRSWPLTELGLENGPLGGTFHERFQPSRNRPADRETWASHKNGMGP